MGRLRGEEDAVREALSMWEERERTRAEILSAVDEAPRGRACDYAGVHARACRNHQAAWTCPPRRGTKHAAIMGHLRTP